MSKKRIVGEPLKSWINERKKGLLPCYDCSFKGGMWVVYHFYPDGRYLMSKAETSWKEFEVAAYQVEWMNTDIYGYSR